MIDEQRQRISALQDGVLNPSEIVPLLEASALDEEVRATWERFHLIGLVMRNEPLDPARRVISETVRSQLAGEPALVARTRMGALRPGLERFAPLTSAWKGLRATALGRGRFGRGEGADPGDAARRWVTPRSRGEPPSRATQFAGIGLAAVAAVMTVFVVPQWLERDQAPWRDQGPSPTFAAPSVPASGAKRWDLDQPDLAHKLDFFLVTHQETAPANGAKGLLPYATFVGYEAGQ